LKGMRQKDSRADFNEEAIILNGEEGDEVERDEVERFKSRLQ